MLPFEVLEHNLRGRKRMAFVCLLVDARSAIRLVQRGVDVAVVPVSHRSGGGSAEGVSSRQGLGELSAAQGR